MIIKSSSVRIAVIAALVITKLTQLTQCSLGVIMYYNVRWLDMATEYTCRAPWQ